MLFTQLNKFFPCRKLIQLILGLAIGIQLIVILYNNFSGFYPLEGLSHFLLRMLRGTILSFIAGLIIAVPDLLLIQFLNRKFPWGSKVLVRVTIQLLLTIVLGFVVSTIITLIANRIKTYTENLALVLFYNALIYAVVNIILVAILEAWLFFLESRREKLKAEKLEKELSQVRFEVLKSQINPHFMFNSLNVLSGLIEKDIGKAQQFIEEFSQIYRYVLETIEKPVVSFGEELSFVRSYIFLQQIRYGEALQLKVNVPAELLQLLLPPLSLQIVLENAIKHNIVNASNPLVIEIITDINLLVIRNNIQPKISANKSTRLGQLNLQRRYSMICDEKPVFMVENNFYLAKLPLLKAE
jgi:two-component system, LytTR family, sensor kinase